MTAPTSIPSPTPSSIPSPTRSRPNRAERRAAARGKGSAEQAVGVPAPRVTGHVHTRARGGPVGAPRRTG